MDCGLRKSISFNKSFHGSYSSSSSSSKRHRTPSSSYYNADADDDDDQHPILFHPHHDCFVDDDLPTMMTPTSLGEVIVKIDDTDANNNKSKNNNNAGIASSNNSSSSKEFSFRKPDNNVAGNEPTSKLIGRFLEQQRLYGDTALDMDMDMDELRHQQQQNQQQQQQPVAQQQEHSIRRQALQGLPPLPRDMISRQNCSRNPSEVQSPDSSNCPKIVAQMVNASANYNSNTNCNSNNNSGNINVDGPREVRVSFQESFNPENLRRGSAIYSTVDMDDTDSSATSSEVEGDQEGSRNGLRSRKGSLAKSNTNISDEVIRCTSNSASSRKMGSSVSIRAKSRLMDPPSSQMERRSGLIPKSGQINTKSGFLGKSSNLDDDEDDPFFGEDLPEGYKKGKISTLVILEWVSLVLLVGALICSLVIPVWKKKSLWHMKLWKWQVLVLVTICGRLVSGFGIKILVFFIERNFLLRKRVLYFVYGLKKAVQNVIWLGLVLLTWHLMFDKTVEEQANSEPLKVVTKLLVICEIGAVLWLLKTFLVKICASTFHVNAFFDRIQESLFNQFVIETLSGPPLFNLQEQEDAERAMDELRLLQNAGINVPADLRASVMSRTNSKSGQINQSGKISMVGQSKRLTGSASRKNNSNEEGFTMENLHKLNQKNVSAWNMKRLMKIVRHGYLTTLDEQIVDATNQDDESSTQIRSEVEAKAAGRKMFRNVARPRAKYIYLNDLLRFMREDEAVKTMGLFEGASETERISKSALKIWVVNAFRERRALALTLSDTKTAVNKLHKMVNVIVTAIIILFGTIFLNIMTSKSIVFFSSQIVVVAFVFGNMCKNVFESIIFLFVIHPFDVGDRCEIDNVQMVVEEMNILTTVFLRYDNQKIIFPNYILLMKPIHNFYRSPDMGDAIEFLVHIATPAEKIALMRQRITSYIDNKKEHWYPDPMIILKDAEMLHMLRIGIYIQHRMNHQDMGERWVRRAVLLEECVKIFRELDIEYRVYPVNVNINSMTPLSYAGIPSPQRTNPSAEVVHP